MPGKIRVAVIFGGKSAEHEISLLSARNVIAAIDRDTYDVSLIGIDKDGRWRLHEEAQYLLHADDPERIALAGSSEEVTVVANGAAGALVNFKRPGARRPVDVAFPVLHGTFGEDGTVQGLLKLMDVPFVGPSVLGSAVGMDKDVAKRLLRDAGIPNSDFVVLRQGEPINAAGLVARLGLPCFVKPANLGSSVGIHKAHDLEELAAAIADAFQYDRKVLIEEYIEGRELECAVLGNEAPIASIAGEVVPKHEFYSYEAKYLDADGATLVIPARLDAPLLQRLQEMAVATFRALECEGMARVDFFLRGKDELFVNEINTIPGFTKISMYPKLWEASGIGYTELIHRLIQLAIARHRSEKQLRTNVLAPPSA